MSWQRQVEGDLAKEFRLVTYDLRGHGNSDKPLEPEKYKESKAWADEVQAIINAANFKRPVLVGWSYGGHVIADYLKIHGAAGLAGLNYVDAVTKSDPSFYGAPAGLPHSCASILTPSGALTTSGLYFSSRASSEAEIATIVWSSPFDGFESDAMPCPHLVRARATTLIVIETSHHRPPPQRIAFKQANHFTRKQSMTFAAKSAPG